MPALLKKIQENPEISLYEEQIRINLLFYILTKLEELNKSFKFSEILSLISFTNKSELVKLILSGNENSLFCIKINNEKDEFTYEQNLSKQVLELLNLKRQLKEKIE